MTSPQWLPSCWHRETPQPDLSSLEAFHAWHLHELRIESRDQVQGDLVGRPPSEQELFGFRGTATWTVKGGGRGGVGKSLTPTARQ